MGWGHFGRSKRTQSLGTAELEVAGGALGGRPASDDSVSTSQAWAPLGSLGPQQWAAATTYPSVTASSLLAHHRCVSLTDKLPDAFSASVSPTQMIAARLRSSILAGQVVD